MDKQGNCLLSSVS